MLELERKQFEVKIDGQVYNLKMPTYKQSVAYKKQVTENASDEVKSAELLLSYLNDLGLPLAVGETLEVEHLGQLLEFILGSAKK